MFLLLKTLKIAIAIKRASPNWPLSDCWSEAKEIIDRTESFKIFQRESKKWK